MELRSQSQSLSLYPARYEGDSEAGLRWLIVVLDFHDGTRDFRASGPWVTENEWRALAEWIAAGCSSDQETRFELTEPNLCFIFGPQSQVLTVRLDQEARPPWLKTPEISFEFPLSVRSTLAAAMFEEFHAVSRGLRR